MKELMKTVCNTLYMIACVFAIPVVTILVLTNHAGIALLYIFSTFLFYSSYVLFRKLQIEYEAESNKLED